MQNPPQSDVRRTLPAPLGLLPESWKLPPWLRSLIGRVSGISGIEVVAGCLDFDANPGEFARQALVRLGVKYTLSASEIEHVPQTGGVIVIANHPFGGVDGLIAINALHARRPDLKLLANGVLARLKPLQSAVLPVDMFGGDSRTNAQSVRAALRHVAEGGALFTFPAGEVAHLQWRFGKVFDPAWPRSAARLIQLAGVPVVPMFIGGRNSALFQLVGLVHPKLRTLLLPREALNKSGTTVNVRIGAPIKSRRIAKLASPAAMSAHLRASVRLLAGAPLPEPKSEIATAPSAAGQVAQPERVAVPLAEPVDAARMSEELAALPAAQRLTSSNALEVYCASASQIPWTLQEIGRLRELTFRAVGEGTGRPADLDLFDDYYEHLFIWHAKKREIVGAYRLGQCDKIRKRFGPRGLYLTSLFEFREPFFTLLGPALELGRSFVRFEYQRSYAPLLLLWKGISEYIGRHPQYAWVIGAASVSNSYDLQSRTLLVEALRAWRSEPLLGALVNPRRPFKPRYSMRSLFGEAGLDADMDALGSLIEDREPDGKGVPVLLRHYLKLGARTIGFNIDTDFGNSLDCLIVLDLRRVPVETLQKYMSADALQEFRGYWRLLPQAPVAQSARG